MRTLCIAALIGLGGAAHAESFRFEAETGAITTASGTGNTRVASSVPGFSGTGYVTGFPNQDAVVDRLTVGAMLPNGLYDLYIGYRSPYGDKGYELSVGGESASGMFAESSSFAEEYGGLFYLENSPIDIQISEGWGYYDVDYFEFRSAQVRQPLPVNPVLSNPAATPNNRYLMTYLTEQYGSQTLFGQQREYYNPNAIMTAGVLSHTGGIFPAVVGGDLTDYSPSRVENGANANGESERLVSWAQQTGGVVSLMWHWNAPSGLIDQPGREWWRGFYTDATTFDLGAALANPSSNEYSLLIRDIDAISSELQKFEAADVPVLWRPLHEAQGNDQGAWFWWGDSGPDALKELWGIMYDRMTNVHGLDNLIWVSTMQVDASNWQEWYPGDDVVDIVGVDVYSDQPDNNMSSQWLELLEEFDGEKMIALSETGSLPPEEVLERYGVAFSYMLPWNEDFLTNDQSAATVQGIVGDDDVIDLSELPVTPWRQFGTSLPGDYDGSGSVDDNDLLVWRDLYGLTGATPADGNGDGIVNAADYTVWRDNYGQSNGVAVPEPGALAMLVLVCFGATGQRNRRR
ncbi:Mannan endo-1,4-beta-mannosidase [Botrimarina colliarenosi]|uniref:Mannan endo-1,4-beta-mannosidase n=1 Tax=Botrimarina colliarenosi TaxID=2528001 RepID=A0A5C6A0W9_9BACT|nr:glycosyl hydrolase [Botrimarina colliarenosi]TWT92848.1 Mannan endo-1,4-beta-mannosidase [Botrimarina colliarenosi]